MEYDKEEDAELRYKIRSIIPNLGEQADTIIYLREQLEHCLEKKADRAQYRRCLVMIDSMADITKDSHDKMPTTCHNVGISDNPPRS